MILFPAIDLAGGQCVRLLRGDMEQATVYNPQPADQAARFRDAGCRWIHVVDLDGAFSGRSVNGDAVEAVISAGVPVQLGGGIRTMDAIGDWLERGVARVVLGTAALRDPDLVRESCRAFPGRIAVGIDARGGMAAAQGWSETTEIRADALARRFEDCGVAALIFTDIDRDGALTGLNLPATVALAAAVQVPVIASGGVSSIDDLIGLAACRDSGICGVICGRALYDGRLDLAEGLRVLDADPPC